MSKLLRIAMASIVIGSLVHDAGARAVSISGTDTCGEVGKKCGAAGGLTVGIGAKLHGFNLKHFHDVHKIQMKSGA